MLNEVEQTGLGVEVSNGKSIAGMLFADDFVGVSNSRQSLQKIIDVVHGYCNRWRLKMYVSKMVWKVSGSGECMGFLGCLAIAI